MPRSYQTTIFAHPAFMKGMTYAGFNKDVFLSEASNASIDRLAETGTEWVALAVGWWQQGKYANIILAHPEKTPSDESLRHIIRYIHEKGMKVMLKPFVDAYDHTWRGEFNPDSKKKWFQFYEAFITHYALIAEEEGVELFSVGCENTLGRKRTQKRWVKVIDKVKEVYKGKLTYSANFNGDIGYDKVLFWDHVDYIGVDAYFAVAEQPRSSVESMMEGWRKQIDQLVAWRATHHPDIPILFTELGVCSYLGAATRPWAYEETPYEDWQEQANYYQAFFEAFADEEWLHGVFWWWWDNPSTGDFMDGGNQYAHFYTPKGKPAEQVLTNWYKGEIG
ncbi:MAG: hypothetical protein AAFR66_04605 [Bacteroidota bacterium]